MISRSTEPSTARTVAMISLMLAALVALPVERACAAEKAPPKAAANAKKLSPNAALVYWRAFALLPSADAKAPPLPDWRKAKIDDKTRTAVEGGKHSLGLLHQAAAIDACDWGIDWSKGIATLLPHLGKVRRLARLAMLRAKVHQADKKIDDALADAVAVLRLSRHVAHDGVLVEMLVGIAVENMALDMLVEQAPALTAERKKALLAELDRLPPGTDLALAVLAEKNGLIDPMIANLRSGKAKNLAQAMGQDSPKASPKIDILPAMAMVAMAEDLAAKYVAIAAAAALPPDKAATELEKLEKTYAKSLNPLAKSLLPTVWSTMLDHQAKLIKKRQTLRDKLSPPVAK